MLCAKDGCSDQTVGRSKYCRVHRDEARAAWLGKVRASGDERKARDEKWEKIHDEAHRAGMVAAEACKPVPMVVQQHANMLDDSSPAVQTWVVPDGVCGFAWVVIRPANCSFALWLKKREGDRVYKCYTGGLQRFAPLSTQSMQIKEAYCEAYAKVLQAAGIKAYAYSRLD